MVYSIQSYKLISTKKYKVKDIVLPFSSLIQPIKFNDITATGCEHLAKSVGRARFSHITLIGAGGRGDASPALEYQGEVALHLSVEVQCAVCIEQIVSAA